MEQVVLQVAQSALSPVNALLNLPAWQDVQTTPLPSKPAAVQAQVNEPAVLAHVEVLPAAQLLRAVAVAHSLMSTQETPVPLKPSLQAHVKEATTFVQMAVPAAQLCVMSVHSFTSVHTTPLPMNPSLQAHLKEPAMLVHVDALPAAQLCVLSVHSLSSVHATPLPV